MKNNKNKNYIICGIIVLAIIAVLIAGFFLLRKDNNTPNVNGPTNDFVNGTDNTVSINKNEIAVGDFVGTLLDANNADKQVAFMLEPWFRLDDVTKIYADFIGKSFLNEYNIASTSSGKITVPNNTKRIFFFNTYDDETLNSYIDDYLLLGARAKDAEMYEIYVINTNFDTMETFIANDLGYVQNNPTEESIKFFETFPDNFLMYVDENNIIQFVSSVKNAYSTAETAAYVFGTEIPCHELLIAIREYVNDFDSAYQKYMTKVEYKELMQVESIVQLNHDRGYSFNVLEDGELFNMFGVNIVKSNISIVDEVLTFIGNDADNSEISYTIYQTYNSKKNLINTSSYEYFNTIDDSSISVNVYGNSKEDIKVLKFEKNGVYAFVLIDGTGLSIEQAKVVAENF